MRVLIWGTGQLCCEVAAAHEMQLRRRRLVVVAAVVAGAAAEGAAASKQEQQQEELHAPTVTKPPLSPNNQNQTSVLLSAALISRIVTYSSNTVGLGGELSDDFIVEPKNGSIYKRFQQNVTVALLLY